MAAHCSRQFDEEFDALVFFDGIARARPHAIFHFRTNRGERVRMNPSQGQYLRS